MQQNRHLARRGPRVKWCVQSSKQHMDRECQQTRNLTWTCSSWCGQLFKIHIYLVSKNSVPIQGYFWVGQVQKNFHNLVFYDTDLNVTCRKVATVDDWHNHVSLFCLWAPLINRVKSTLGVFRSLRSSAWALTSVAALHWETSPRDVPTTTRRAYDNQD